MIKRFKKQFWSNNSNLLCFVSSYYRNITYMSIIVELCTGLLSYHVTRMYPNLDVGLKRRKIYNNTFKCIVPNMPHLKLPLPLSKMHAQTSVTRSCQHNFFPCAKLLHLTHSSSPQTENILSLTCVHALTRSVRVCVCVCVCVNSLFLSLTHTHTHSPPAYMSMWIFCACVSAPSHH